MTLLMNDHTANSLEITVNVYESVLSRKLCFGRVIENMQ